MAGGGAEIAGARSSSVRPSAAAPVGAGGEAVDGVDDHVELDAATATSSGMRTRRELEDRREAIERDGRARESAGRAAARDDRLDGLRDDGGRQRLERDIGAERAAFAGRRGPGGAPRLHRRRGRERRGRVGLANQRIVDLVAGERQGREAEAGQGRCRRGGPSAGAEREHGERRLVGLIDVEQARDVVVDESGDDVGRDAERGRDGKQIRDQRARVPEAVPVGARPVLPGVPPKGARQHEQDGSVGHVRLVAGGARRDARGGRRRGASAARSRAGRNDGRPRRDRRCRRTRRTHPRDRARPCRPPRDRRSRRRGRCGASEHARTEVEQVRQQADVERAGRSGRDPAIASRARRCDPGRSVGSGIASRSG